MGSEIADNHIDNYCQSFIFNSLHIRGNVVKLQDVYQDIIYLQNVNTHAEVIIGQVLVAAAMMIQSIKIKSQITVQFQSKDEDIKLVAAKINTEGKLRATIRCKKKPQEALLGQGHLVVTIEKLEKLENLEKNIQKSQSYQSIIEINQGETIASSLERYFIQSEQLPSLFKFACNDNKASGIMVQQTKEFVAEDDWETVTHLFNSLTDQELLDLDSKIILHRLFNQYDIVLYPAKELSFQCNCSVAKMQNAIKSLGKEDALDILVSKKVIEVTCDYCKTHYDFNRADVEAIFSQH